jgi:hypothetical protein
VSSDLGSPDDSSSVRRCLHRPQEGEVAVWDLGEAYLEGPRLRAANKR